MENLADFLPGIFFRLMNRVLAWRQQHKQNPLASSAISNVPGPREKLVSEDGALEALYSAGVLGEGMGLNITVWSYMDQLNVSALACHRAMPDLERLTGYIPEAIRELQAAVFHRPLSIIANAR